MKKLNILLAALLSTLASCGKLPNASITGATFGDYVPYIMMWVGVACVGLFGWDWVKTNKIDSVKGFVGVLGIILFVMGFVFKS